MALNRLGITRTRKVYDPAIDNYRDDVAEYVGLFADCSNARIFNLSADIQPADRLSVSEDRYFVVREVRNCGNHIHALGSKDEK